MFTSLFFLQKYIFIFNIQLDKLFLFGRYVNKLFIPIVFYLVICLFVNSVRSFEIFEMLYLYFNISFIYFLLFTRISRNLNWSYIISDFILIIHVISLVMEPGSEGRGQGLLGANGAFVFLVFSLSDISKRKRLLLLFILSGLISYYTEQRSALLLTIGLSSYLVFSSKSVGKKPLRKLVLLLIFLVPSVAMFLIYGSDFLSRGITLAMIADAQNLSYEKMVANYSGINAISDLERLHHVYVFFQEFNYNCIFGCYWQYARPLHSNLLEITYFTGILGVLTVSWYVGILFRLLTKSVESCVLMVTASIVLVIGPIQFYPIYYLGLRLLYYNLDKATEAV